MRCKICGAKLKNEGDICRNCYNEYKSYKNMVPTNEEELLKINRKFRINLSLILTFVIAGMSGFAYYGATIGILVAVIALLCIIGTIIFEKRRADGTKITFYETRLMYISKYLCFDFEEIILYDELTDIQCFKSFSQKIRDIGDVRFYKKKLLSGVTFADMPNISENYEKVRTIINTAISKEN